jgi:hypothetical protein
MELFNKREDVIDLELTPYGELLLLEGVFKPTYYAFFDDEVLYDSRYAGIEVEAQNKIKDRIKEVPRLKTQYLFTNTELPSVKIEDYAAKVFKGEITTLDLVKTANLLPQEKIGALSYEPMYYLKLYTLPLPLGNCSFETEHAPAWDINLLYNNLDQQKDGTYSVEIFSSSIHPTLKIPQMDVTIQYVTEGYPLNMTPKTSTDNADKSENFRLKEFDELHENPPIYNDGYYDFQEDFIVLEINENNVPFLKENFDIEVYEITHDNPDHDLYYNKKDFIKKPTVVDEKGLLKSEEESIRSNEKDLELKLLPLNNTYVEHYFNVYVDYEIDKDLMCKLKPNIKQKGFFISDPLDCLEDKDSNILSSDIYKKAIETVPECN